MLCELSPGRGQPLGGLESHHFRITPLFHRMKLPFFPRIALNSRMKVIKENFNVQFRRGFVKLAFARKRVEEIYPYIVSMICLLISVPMYIASFP
jgi:hypothetical protein